MMDAYGESQGLRPVRASLVGDHRRLMRTEIRYDPTTGHGTQTFVMDDYATITAPVIVVDPRLRRHGDR